MSMQLMTPAALSMEGRMRKRPTSRPSASSCSVSRVSSRSTISAESALGRRMPSGSAGSTSLRSWKPHSVSSGLMRTSTSWRRSV